MSVIIATIELTYPPPPWEELVKEMETEILKHVPVGQKLVGLRKNESLGPDLRDDLSGPCYRMRVSFETEEIEPLLGEHVD